MGNGICNSCRLAHLAPSVCQGTRIDVRVPYIRIHNAIAPELGWLLLGSRAVGSVCAQQELHGTSALLRAAAWRALVVGSLPLTVDPSVL